VPTGYVQDSCERGKSTQSGLERETAIQGRKQQHMIGRVKPRGKRDSTTKKGRTERDPTQARIGGKSNEERTGGKSPKRWGLAHVKKSVPKKKKLHKTTERMKRMGRGETGATKRKESEGAFTRSTGIITRSRKKEKNRKGVRATTKNCIVNRGSGKAGYLAGELGWGRAMKEECTKKGVLKKVIFQRETKRGQNLKRSR